MTTIIRVDEAGSTNTLLAERYSDMPHGTIVSARCQTSGRGQRGNHWESEPGCNLTFSMLLRPAVIMAASQFELSMIVSLAVCDSLSEVSGVTFSVKWPNDIYAGDKKICGILIENSLAGRRITRSIAGIGINVNQQVFLSDAPNPVSLFNLTGRSYDLDTLLDTLSDNIMSRLSAYETMPDAETLTDLYNSRLWRREGFHKWLDTSSGMIFEAAIDNVSSSGLLTLRDRCGDRHSFAFKEVAAIL